MIRSRFSEIFNEFKPNEFKLLRDRLLSPSLNTEHRLIPAFDELCSQIEEGFIEFDDARIFRAAYGNKKYNDPLLRVLLSKIYKQVLKYLHDRSIEEQEALHIQGSALRYFRHHHFDRLFSEYSKRQMDVLEEYPYRNDSYFEYQYHLLVDIYLFQISRRREGAYNIHAQSDCIDTQYFIRRLKNICRIYNLKQNQMRAEDEKSFLFIQANLRERKELLQHYVLQFYYCMSHCYLENYSEAFFNQARQIFLSHERLFNFDEARENYTMLLNYGIRKVNQGVDEYKEVLFELYERALERNMILDNDKISRFTYRNITEAALSLKKFEWAEHFITKYKIKLESAYRNFLFDFEKSRILSEQKKYDEALDHIANISFDDPLMELACRLERIRIFVELNNFELAEYHLRSMKTYIQRNVNIGYQSKYYKNFAIYLLKIIKLQFSEPKKLNKLAKEIEAVEIITERKYLLNLILRSKIQ